MYELYKNIKPTTSIECNNAIEAISIEEKMRQVTQSGEPISGDVAMVYDEPKDGVKPEYDIRTDKWEIAQNAMDYVSRQNALKTNAPVEKTVTGTENIETTSNE